MASIILTCIRLPVLVFGPTLPPPVAAINQPRLLQIPHPVHSHAPFEYSEEEEEDGRRAYSGGPMRDRPVQRSRGSRSACERYGSADTNSRQH
jgi:hypothetical protein